MGLNLFLINLLNFIIAPFFRFAYYLLIFFVDFDLFSDFVSFFDLSSPLFADLAGDLDLSFDDKSLTSSSNSFLLISLILIVYLNHKNEIFMGDGGTLFIGFVISIGLLIYSLPRWTGPVRRYLDRYPPWVLYRDFSGAMLIVSLSTLMRSGVSLRSSLERALRYSSPWLSWHVKEILLRLSRPNSSTFGDAFQTGLDMVQLSPDTRLDGWDGWARLAQRTNVDKAANAELAAWFATSRIMLNLDEFLTRE